MTVLFYDFSMEMTEAISICQVCSVLGSVLGSVLVPLHEIHRSRWDSKHGNIFKCRLGLKLASPLSHTGIELGEENRKSGFVDVIGDEYAYSIPHPYTTLVP